MRRQKEHARYAILHQGKANTFTLLGTDPQS